MLGVSPTLSDGGLAELWDTDPKPFVWRTPAEEILRQSPRGRDTLNDHTNSVSDHEYAKSAIAARITRR